MEVNNGRHCINTLKRTGLLFTRLLFSGTRLLFVPIPSFLVDKLLHNLDCGIWATCLSGQNLAGLVYSKDASGGSFRLLFEPDFRDQ